MFVRCLKDHQEGLPFWTVEVMLPKSKDGQNSWFVVSGRKGMVTFQYN